MSQYFRLHPDNPQPRLVKQAVQIINDGGVVALPTDSSYALACHLDDKDDTGNGGPHDAGEKGCHPNDGEGFRLNAQFGEPKLAQGTKEQAELAPKTSMGAKSPPGVRAA